MSKGLPKGLALSNLPIRTKLWAVVLVLSVPILSLVFFQYQVRQDEIDRANSESNGIQYISAVVPLLRDIQLHRGLTEQVAGGNAPAREALTQSAAAVDVDIANLRGVDSRFGAAFHTTEAVAAIQTEWAKLREAAAGQPNRDTTAGHADLVGSRILPLLNQVGKQSKLFLDPDVDTRSVIVALTEDLPRMTESLARARGFGAAALFERDGQPATDAQKLYLTEQITIMTTEFDSMVRNVEAAMAANPAFEKSLRQLLTRSQTSKDTFVVATNTKIISAPRLVATDAPIFLLTGTSAIDAGNKILEGARGSLQKEFDTRASAAQWSLIVVAVATVGGILLAIGLALAIAQTITAPLNRLAEAADRMSLGEMDVEIDVEQDNEIGKLAESLRRMQTSLQAAIERLRARRTTAA